MNSELEIQHWLQTTIAEDKLVSVIGGRSKVQAILKQHRSPEFWPNFPIDYLTRLRVLETTDGMLDDLYGLEPVSANTRSISRTRGEALFVDILYARPEGSKFVVIEVKKDKATARETITELLAYEHEIQNHVPFASSRDILLIIVAREYPVLLDHAVCGLITWARRRILCLRFSDTSGDPSLEIHTPSPWAAVGQTVLPDNGLQIAQLSLRLNRELSSDETRSIFETAALLMAREAERAGGSGFVFVAENIFFPGLSQSEYVLIAGALNPYCFLQQAEQFQFVDESDSSLSAYLLDDERREDLSISWDWIGTDGGAATSYLEQFGSVSWEGTSTWAAFRESLRWRCKSVTADRYLVPINADAWGVLGDYMRDVVRHQNRLKNFMPGYCKPGIDWRYPWFAAQLLDDLSLPAIVEAGQWTFRALFVLGLRLGRYTTYAAQFADADENDRRKLRPSLFWAEVDILRLIEEVRLRYIAALKLHTKPPMIKIGLYETGVQVMGQSTEFAKWIVDEFIGAKETLLRSAFATGLEVFGLYDPTCEISGDAQKLRTLTVSRARAWLTSTVDEVFGGHMKAHSLEDLRFHAESIFAEKLPLCGTKETALKAIAMLSDTILIDALIDTLPRMIDCWCPQLGHVLAPISITSPDWDWLEQQIREHQRRGVENPCILVSAGGQFGVGAIPPGTMQMPRPANPETEVLVLLNESFASFVLPMTWADLRLGKVPGFFQQNPNNS